MIHPAYVAGLIDGDGCITAFLKKTRSSPHGYVVKGRIKITSKDKAFLEIVKEEFGGKLVNRGDGLYDLCWESFSEIESLLKIIMPHLIEKYEQAQYLYHLCRLKRSRNFQDKCVLVRKIQSLNSGGPLPDGG